jgi:hypothetical protein
LKRLILIQDLQDLKYLKDFQKNVSNPMIFFVVWKIS